MNKPRLIDANKLNDALIDLFREIDNMYIAGRVISLVNLQPTAYDIDKVVEQLKEQENENGALAEMDWYAGLSQGFHEAIEIVKKGGAE